MAYSSAHWPRKTELRPSKGALVENSTVRLTREDVLRLLYRLTRDLFLAQRFARHASPLTTTVYTHPGDEEMMEQVRRLSC